jgi:hypothetical protein
MYANSALFIAGGLVVLLLFGCVGPTEPADSQQPLPPKQPDQPAGDIGDSEISSPEPDEIDDLLPEDDVLIPPLDDSEENTSSGNQSNGSDLKIDVSDLFVDEGSDFDYISEDDIIEPI